MSTSSKCSNCIYCDLQITSMGLIYKCELSGAIIVNVNTCGCTKNFIHVHPITMLKSAPALEVDTHVK